MIPIAENNKPTVGIFVTMLTIKLLNLQREQFEGSFRVYGLQQASRKLNIPIYFFSIKDVNMRKAKIRGTVFNERKQIWEKKILNFPDILYDRCGDYVGPRQQRAQAIRLKFEKLGILSINTKHHFDKWEIYRHLRQDEEIRPFLPLTKRLWKFNDLKLLLKQANTVYLKVVNGSRGRRIMRISKLAKGGYRYRYYINHTVVGTEKKLIDVYRKSQALYVGRRVLLQEAIPLIRIEDRLVDLRAELQRNRKGELEIVGICARIGQQKSPITIHSQAFPFEVFFRQHLKYSNEQIAELKNRVEQFLRSIYQRVEQIYGPFGELGIDLGIDAKGKIWFIECNAKSAKVSLLKAYNHKTLEKSFLNPLEYAKYIYEKR